MTKKSSLIIALLLMQVGCATVNNSPQTKKLSDDERLVWWRDASFGLFIHWGAYSIPGGERDGKICRGGAEWIMDKLDYTIEDYEKVVAQFNPVKFNADEWVSIAKDAGMKYIVITSKHHDGFCLWDSKITDYDIMDASPFKRDIIKELSEACKKQGLKFCFYHSIVDWHHPQAQAPLYPNYNAGQRDQSIVNPEFPEYYKNYLKPQVKELLTNYGDIGVVWFDGDWIADYTTEMGKELYALIREIQPNTIVNNRVDKGRMGMEGIDREGNFAGDFGTPEQEIPDTGISTDWESCMTMNGSWGYKPSDRRWKSTERLIHNLIDVVSKGGNLLLNVGPSGEGLFPAESVERLKAMGVWTKANGESIYGAKASPYEKPEWGRYTSKPGVLYAHVFDWPQEGLLVINQKANVKKASLLAESGRALTIKKSELSNVIVLPQEAPDSIATVIKLEVASDYSHEYYVAGTGSDMNPGTKAAPFLTLEKAQSVVRDALPTATEGITVWIRGGTYYLDQPLVFGPDDSGTTSVPVAYKGYAGETVVLSGGKEVRNWTKTDLNGRSVLVSDLSTLPEGYTPFEQLWVNGHRAIQARTPNRGYLKIPSASEVEPNSRDRGRTYDFSYVPADEHYLDGVEDGVAVVFNKWLEYHMPLDRIDRENRRIICTKKSGRAIEADDDYYLEGGRAMLDRPGEWYLDRKAHKLYYYPLAGESKVVAVIPSLVNVLRLQGDAGNDRWVEHVQFRGLTFSHTTWVLPRTSGPSGYGQADIQMEGAVRLQDTRHCLLEECEIVSVGNYGLEIATGCSENRVLRCDIHDLGGGGLLIGPKIRPRSPKEGYKPGEDVPLVLKCPTDATSRNEIADCRIYDGGRYFHCAVGIWIGQSPDNHVHHNEIFDFYYSGISCGWTWGYGTALAVGNRFEYNHIHHIGQRRDGDGRVLSDMGGIYTLGEHTGTVIRYNVFHDVYAGKYGGWAIYFDEGTRNILAENNLVYRCRHSCFDQHYGKDNIVRNNIFAFGDTSVVCLARAEEHTSFILTNNIFLSHGPPMYAGGYAHKVNTPGVFKADHNLVWSTNSTVLGAQDRFPSRLYEPNEPVLSWEQWQALGYDRHSIIADPNFKDPANGDFRLSEDSPAKRIGFKPFALDQAGPR